MTRWTFLCVALLAIDYQADGGAWTRPRGSGFLQLGFSTIGYSRVYDASGMKVDAPADVRDNVFQFYAEYGLTDAVTVSASVPMKFVTASPRGTSALFPDAGTVKRSGIGDIDVAIRAGGGTSGGLALAGELLFGLPSGSDEHSRGLLLGDGELNAELRFLAGKSFYPFPAYASAAIGYNVRGSGFSHDVMMDLEGGVGLWENSVMPILQISIRRSMRTSPTPDPVLTPSVQLGLDTHNREWTAIIPKVLLRPGGRIGVVLSYATALHGRVVAGGAVLAANLFYEW